MSFLSAIMQCAEVNNLQALEILAGFSGEGRTHNPAGYNTAAALKNTSEKIIVGCRGERTVIQLGLKPWDLFGHTVNN